MRNYALMTLTVLLVITGCARSGPPAPVDIRGVGAGETRPGMGTSASGNSSPRYGASQSYPAQSGYGQGTGSNASIQVQNLGEPDDAYAQASRGSTTAPAPTTTSTWITPSYATNNPQPAYQTTTQQQMQQRPVETVSPPVQQQQTQPRTLLPTVPPTSSTSPKDIAPASILGDGAFGWPLRGKILSGYGTQAGGQANDGINIAGSTGNRIYAARAGDVSYAGNEVRHLGNVVLVRHPDGYITVYAHLDQIYVSKGDNVLKGQPLGTVGQSGNVDQPQLHFEIRKDSNPVDPTKYLGR